MKTQIPQWSGDSLSGTLRRTASKVTSSKLCFCYFIFSLLYCTVQTALSARSFIDNSAGDLLEFVARQADSRNLSIPVFNNNQLALCASDFKSSDYHCTVVWDGTPKNNNSALIERRGGQFNDSVTAVPVTLPDGKKVSLSESCVWSLNYPMSELRHAKRENVAFICFQIWVFTMSITAIMSESIPHILATLLTHAMALIWSVYTVIQSTGFQLNFKNVITDGACSGANILPELFKIRKRTEIPTLAINFLALVISCFLTMKLIGLLNWRNFKNVGANLQMNRHRKIMLVLFINIQLSAFFVIISSSLLLDSLLKGNLSVSASFPALYKTAAILMIAMAIPWLASGWYAVQYELRLPMFFFLAWALIWLIGFGVMFFSTSFVQEFIHWPFFATTCIIAVILDCISFVLGVACRFNFGKGYLIAKDVQANTPIETKERPWDVESSPHTEEKIVFPEPNTPNLPQLTSTFDPPSTLSPPPPSLFNPKSSRLGGSHPAQLKGQVGRLVPFTLSFSTSSSRAAGTFGPRSNNTSASSGPPAYVFRDSTSSFGNSQGLSSAGHGASVNASRTPSSLPTASSTGQHRANLNRMFTASSSSSSMYTDGSLSPQGHLEHQDSWSSFGVSRGNTAKSTDLHPHSEEEPVM